MNMTIRDPNRSASHSPDTRRSPLNRKALKFSLANLELLFLAVVARPWSIRAGRKA
jgi:hypothetical protein